MAPYYYTYNRIVEQFAGNYKHMSVHISDLLNAGIIEADKVKGKASYLYHFNGTKIRYE